MKVTVLVIAALTAASLAAQTPLIDQGRAALVRGDTDAAMEILEKAAAQSPQNADAHFYLGTAYESAGEKSTSMFSAMKLMPKFKEEYEKAVALNPKLIEARYGLVQFYSAAPAMMGGSYDKALEHAKEIKALDPVAGHRAYAIVYAAQKNTDAAKKEYLDAIKEQPNSAKAHTYYAQYLLDAEKNFAAAAAEVETALKADPTYMPAQYYLGRASVLANANLPRGEEALKKYLGYMPKYGEPARANTYSWLGMVDEKQGRKAEAKQNFEAALKLNPNLKQAESGLKRVE